MYFIRRHTHLRTPVKCTRAGASSREGNGGRKWRWVLGVKGERKTRTGSLVRSDGGVLCTKALDRFNVHQEKKKKKTQSVNI